MADIKFTKSGVTKLIRDTSEKAIARLKKNGWLAEEPPAKKPATPAKEK